jgi:hypothetical protein
MPRYFTLAEAERTLPGVERQIREALFLKAEFQRADEELKATAKRVFLSGGAFVDRDRVGRLKSSHADTGTRLQELIESIHETGCLVKDLDIGLLDFPTLYRGEEVYLCWKLGETGIRFWHHVADGFLGRQPIDDDFLANHGEGAERA